MECPSCGQENQDSSAVVGAAGGAGRASGAAERAGKREIAPPAGGFIGRQREFNGLKVILSDVLSGRGRVVLLSGEPGIGKTRLSQELAYQAESQGARVLWGSCYEWQGAPPYWPWVQIIRSLSSEQDPEQLREMMGAGAGDIAEIVPELGRLIPSQALPSSLEGEQARFRLFESIASFLNRASREYPLGLFLEDLHWADRPSLLLLEFLAQNLAEARLLLLGTCREAGLTRQYPLILQSHFYRVKWALTLKVEGSYGQGGYRVS